MAFKVDNKRVSKKAWGDVDKSALGKRLAEGYAAGDVSRAQIREVYASAPDDAFGKDSGGKPTFAYSKAWGPHHELDGETIVLNVNGVHAAAAALAGARSEPSLSGNALSQAKAHMRRHYKQLKEDAPDALKESRRRIAEHVLNETVKGSLESIRRDIAEDFEKQFKFELAVSGYEGAPVFPFWICDTFPEGGTFANGDAFPSAVVVKGYELDPDEYWLVTFEKQTDKYVFAAHDQWELIELGYTPAHSMVNENKKKGARKKFNERRDVVLELDEAADDANSAQKPRTIRAAQLITADIVNENLRLYPAPVVRAAVDELKAHLHESAGQGRLVQVLGEAEHPSDKPSKRPNLLETIVKWNEVSFDGRDVGTAGTLLETAKGKDILALVEGGVTLSLSLRGYGESEMVKHNGQMVERVTELHITGIDLVLEPGFADARAIVESQNTLSEGDEMNLEELKKLIAEHPELFKGMVATELESLSAAQLKQIEEKVRAALGIDAQADIFKSLQELAQAKKELEESKRKAAISEAIGATAKDLKYGKLNEAFVAELKAQNPQTTEAVKELTEAMKKRYDALLAQAKLAGMGFAGHSGIAVVGTVLENEAGTPEFARGAHEIKEALDKRPGMGYRWKPQEPKNRNEQFAAMVLERFDACFSNFFNKKTNRQEGLLHESKLLQEAEMTSDLSLPYSTSRAILAIALPQLVASSIFDFDVIATSPTRIYYEVFAGETGLDNTVAMGEAVVTDQDAWVAIAYKNVTPGTLTVKNAAETVTYVEGTDYVFDYREGKLKTLSTGTPIADGATVHIGYQYRAIRKGENVAIERGKLQLAFVLAEAAADRLAQQVTQEAIVFSRSQLGWDPVARTLNALVKEVMRDIDRGIFYRALAEVLSVASNSGGTWTDGVDPLDDLADYIGEAKVKVENRFYEATAVLLSKVNSNTLGNWSGFSAAGKNPANDLKENGYVGRVKGLPAFETVNFSNGYILVPNRELVMHRVYQPMLVKGPFPTYSSDKLVAAEQYYVEEFNLDVAPVPEKGSFVKIA